MCKIKVHILPGSEKFEIKKFDEWRKAWLVSVKEAAEKERANKELLAELSKLFGAKAKIVSGEHSREKIIEISGLDERKAVELLKKISVHL